METSWRKIRSWFWLILAFVSFVVLCVLVGRVQADAADFTLKWDPVSGVAGYRIYQSVDKGATWTLAAEATATEYRVTNVPDDKPIFYRVSPFTASAESPPSWRGVWFDARIKPPAPPQGAGLSD